MQASSSFGFRAAHYWRLDQTWTFSFTLCLITKPAAAAVFEIKSSITFQSSSFFFHDSCAGCSRCKALEFRGSCWLVGKVNREHISAQKHCCLSTRRVILAYEMHHHLLTLVPNASVRSFVQSDLPLARSLVCLLRRAESNSFNHYLSKTSFWTRSERFWNKKLISVFFSQNVSRPAETDLARFRIPSIFHLVLEL